MATEKEYIAALSEFRKDYPYPQYSASDLHRILAQRGIYPPSESEVTEDQEEAEEEDEGDNGDPQSDPKPRISMEGQRSKGMPLTMEEIHQIAETTAHRVMHELKEQAEELHERDMYLGMLIGEGAIPVHGRETRKEPCRACRINPDKPLEAGNIMATTEGAIGTLSKQEVRDWCSEIIEVKDGRCARALRVSKLLSGTTARNPEEMQTLFQKAAQES